MYLIKYKFCHFALLEILFYDFHLIRTGDSPIDYHLATATMSTEIEWRLGNQDYSGGRHYTRLVSVENAPASLKCPPEITQNMRWGEGWE